MQNANKKKKKNVANNNVKMKLPQICKQTLNLQGLNI